MMEQVQCWRKVYDPGLTDPWEWEITYVEAVKDVFLRVLDRTAPAYRGTSITYAKLNRYTSRFAHMLLPYGFAKDDVVGINLPNIPELAIVWFPLEIKGGTEGAGINLF